MSPIPILIISDAPTAGTGLARVTRDIATRIHSCLPEFRVGTLGYGGAYSRSLGFPQYNLDMKDWVAFNLPDVWEDFAGSDKGVIFTVWDSSRLLWFARPENCPDSRLRKFLTDSNFETWAYLPMDATGPHDRLTAILKHTVEGFDRALAYSAWAEGILRRTLWKKPMLNDLTYLPHGIDKSVFYPRDRKEARANFGERIGARNQSGKFLTVPDDVFMVGIVGTNQIRKDHGLGIQAVAELKRDQEVMLWIHTDELERHWSIPALLNDFGLLKNSVVTTIPYTDEQMAWCYSALDCTMAIGLGEGFGFSAAESLFCGVPVVSPNYGGGEFIPKEMLVEPIAYRLEGPYNCIRPVMSVTDFAAKAREVAGKQFELPVQLDWEVLWPRWAEWFRKGIE